MRVIMLIGIVIVLITLPISPSSARSFGSSGCLSRISKCFSKATDIFSCCPTIKEEIENERECFCSSEHLSIVQQNETTASAMAEFLSYCGYTDSLETICSGPRNPALTPSEESTPSPEAGSDSGGRCWKRIADCVKGAKIQADVAKCCPQFKEEIAYERECFCSVKPILRDDPTLAKKVSTISYICNIRPFYTFDSLCPEGPPISSPPTVLPPESPGSPSNASETKLPSPISSSSQGTDNISANTETATSPSQSDSTNMVAYSIGLLPSAFLIIWATIL